jgi:hypothetical protein
MADEWDEALKRFDERTVQRRERAKEHDQKAQEIIRQAEERHGSEKPSDSEGAE